MVLVSIHILHHRLAHVSIKGNMSFSVQELMRKCESKGIACPNVTYFSSNHMIVSYYVVHDVLRPPTYYSQFVCVMKLILVAG